MADRSEWTDASIYSKGEQSEYDKETSDITSLDAPLKVILFNDDIHSFDEVIAQLIKAIGCTSHVPRPLRGKFIRPEKPCVMRETWGNASGSAEYLKK